MRLLEGEEYLLFAWEPPVLKGVYAHRKFLTLGPMPIPQDPKVRTLIHPT